MMSNKAALRLDKTLFPQELTVQVGLKEEAENKQIHKKGNF